MSAVPHRESDRLPTFGGRLAIHAGMPAGCECETQLGLLWQGVAVSDVERLEYSTRPMIRQRFNHT